MALIKTRITCLALEAAELDPLRKHWVPLVVFRDCLDLAVRVGEYATITFSPEELEACVEAIAEVRSLLRTEVRSGAI